MFDSLSAMAERRRADPADDLITLIAAPPRPPRVDGGAWRVVAADRTRTALLSVLTSANRDPCRFTDPNSFGLGRGRNPHLTLTADHVPPVSASCTESRPATRPPATVELPERRSMIVVSARRRIVIIPGHTTGDGDP